jgi:hypothetical protein
MIINKKVFLDIRHHSIIFSIHRVLSLHILHRIFKLDVKQASKLFKKLDCRQLELKVGNILFIYTIITEPVFKHLLSVHKLLEQVLHQVHHTYRCDPIRGHLYQIVTNLPLLEPQVATLHEYLLLLYNYRIKGFNPVENVPMGSR